MKRCFSSAFHWTLLALSILWSFGPMASCNQSGTWLHVQYGTSLGTFCFQNYEVHLTCHMQSQMSFEAKLVNSLKSMNLVPVEQLKYSATKLGSLIDSIHPKVKIMTWLKRLFLSKFATCPLLFWKWGQRFYIIHSILNGCSALK